MSPRSAGAEGRRDQAVLYRGGHVHSPAYPGATALLTVGDTVAWVGADPGEIGAPGPGSGVDAVVDLDGALVTPAFVDAHLHATATGLALGGLDLAAAPTLAAALDTVAAAARADPGTALLGTGWDETRWPGRRAPAAAELDRAAPGRLVYLARVDGHTAAVSTTLAAASGAAGLPGWLGDGLVAGDAHHAARVHAYATISPSQRAGAWRRLRATAARLGIAALHEMAGPDVSSAEDLAALLAHAAAEPGPAIHGYWAGEAAVLADLDPDGRLAVGLGGDLFVDGSLGSHTAALRAPYADRPGHRPAPMLDAAAVRDTVLAAVATGRQPGFHAIGDAALDVVLDGLDAAVRTVGASRVAASRPRVEHCELAHPDQITRLARTVAVAVVQPAFDAAWGGPDGMYATRLGARRAGAMNPFAALAAAGVGLALSSDAPVTPLDPWGAVRAATGHHTPTARLDLATALRAATHGGWHAARADADGSGTLAPGHPATLAVWRLPAGLDPAAGLSRPPLPDLTGADPACARTVLAGDVLFDAGT
ncbi:amidohydrolase family protein [Pseudofrankia sp. BMG5.36]|uniref:amidohydrolase n=1 Tax=Pseudofrankia sp. BMG5.36 TaxID=1834512 RepID=UPI0008DB0CC5|nr:amidohydrolase family protein [Pseudofrankia sp. BMG5.36]OHV45539.1 amidohydrolase [Pseudofrankia sp. BMG5.36]